MHTCETCGNEWPENYCPQCGHTSGRINTPAVPPPLPASEPVAKSSGLFGLFKKRQPASTHSAPPPLPRGEPFWDDMGMGRCIPDYIQIHLASRNPQHTSPRKPDGSIDVDAVPPLIFNDPQIRNGITRLLEQQLPNDAAVLSSLSADEIISRLGGILTKVTGKDMYAIVIRKWCVEYKLL